MGNLNKLLATARKSWGKAAERAKTETGFGSEIDDGRYIVKLSKAKITESQNGRPQIAWEFVITQGDNKGEIIRSYDGLESEDNLVWLGRKLARLGYEIPEEFDDIQGILDELMKEKPTLAVQLKTKGEFQNCYINKLVKGGEEAEEDETGADGNEEEGVPAADESETADSEEEAEEDEAEAEIEVGAKVTYTNAAGNELDGEVIEVLEDEGKVRVKVAGGKVYKTTPEKITLAADVPEEPEVEAEEEVETEEEEAETKPTKSKVTKRSPAPAPKKAAPTKAAPKKAVAKKR